MKSIGKNVGWWCVGSGGGPLRVPEEKLQQTLQASPRSLSQQDHSQAVKAAGKAMKEGIGA